MRLTNSLSHASERADIILLINNIEKRIGDVSEIIKRYCQDINKCNSYREIINEIRSLVRSAVEKQGCRILKLHDLYKDPNSEYCQKCKDCEDCKNYQENSDYQGCKTYRGYLINAGESLYYSCFHF